MQSKITRTAIAAGIILLAYWLTLSNKGVSHAYAIDQTLNALNTIQSVHFKADLYKQGPIECWMLFEDTESRKPTHVCLFMPGFPIRKIDSPDGSFAYNEISNRYQVNRRDERKHNWYPDFANFFTQSLEKAKTGNGITIEERFDVDLDQDVVAITIKEMGRECLYLIDPESKLPIQFTATKTMNFLMFYKKTIAVRSIRSIEYNKSAPEGLFTIPDDAGLVTNEHDILVHPDTGMTVGALSHEQACEKIIRDVMDAMNQRDWEAVQKLLFPFAPPPPEFLSKFPTDPSVKLVEMIEMGKPYEKGAYWYVPLKSKEFGGRTKDEQVPIKFYEFDGQTYCKIMWPD